MRRLLGRPQSDSTANDNSNLGPTSSPLPTSYRPNQSQNVTYQASQPIVCLDRSADGRLAVLGGRDILKTIHIDGLHVREGVDLRAYIQAQQANRSSSLGNQLAIKDVKWSSNHEGEPTIFTACASGQIFQYNVSRLGSATPGGTVLDVIQTQEESRQINKLDTNPHKNTLLLSGGQEGIVRLFDVRSPQTTRNGQLTFRAFKAFQGNSEGIRDIKWCPKDGLIFACATDSGAILKWDVKKANAPLLKINAHASPRGTSSISWHPDGNHLVSGGFDRKVHVWDMSTTAERKQRAKWTISAPAPVNVVSWRPPLWSATAQAKRGAQIAVSYGDSGHGKKFGISAVHIWDLGRPTMPYKEINRFDISPSALLWHDQDLLWTAGLDGLFSQSDVAFAPKVMDRQPLSSLDFSPSGDVVMMLEERAHPPRPRPATAVPEVAATPSLGTSPSGQILSVSRSDSEDDVVGSFLGPRKRNGRRRRPSVRSTQPYSTTPPSGTGTEEPIISLEQAVNLTGTFKPQQIMAIGRVPVASKTAVYQYMSSHYLDALEKGLPSTEDGRPLNERVAGIMDHYARAAETVSQFRLAQTWRILAYAMGLLLTRRSEYHLEMRTARRKNSKPFGLIEKSDSKGNLTKFGSMPQLSQLKVNGDASPRRATSVSSVESRQTLKKSLLAEEIDSESNAATPLARPVDESVTEEQHQFRSSGQTLTPVQEVESFTLPPNLNASLLNSGKPDGEGGGRKRLDSAPISEVSHDSQISSTEGYDFYDMEAVDVLPKAIDMPKKREPLSLEYVGPKTPNTRQRMTVNRHDSDESFAQMFSVSDTSHEASDVSVSSYSRNPPPASRGQPKSGSGSGSRSTPEDEYESRIRGRQLESSPDQKKQSLPRAPVRQDSDLSEIFMISQTTADSLESDYSPKISHEASQNPIEHPAPRLEVMRSMSPRKTSNERVALGRPEEQTSKTVIETDFMPWPDDPDFPFPLLSDVNSKNRAVLPPLDPYKLLSRALEFEAQHSALNASAMVLLLRPLVPDEIIDEGQATAILYHHHQRLMSQKLFVEAALLRNLCVRDWPDGIDVWGDNYTSIFNRSQQRVNVGFTCSQCHKPREIDRSGNTIPTASAIWKCERCRATMAPCAICGHRDATASALTPIPVAEALARSDDADDDTVLATWWYCPGCAHGGHATCIQGWHAPVTPPTTPPSNNYGRYRAGTTSGTSTPGGGGNNYNMMSLLQSHDTAVPETYSDGCCPLDGCGHACLPGKWRNETNIGKAEELGRVVREQTRAGTPLAPAAIQRQQQAVGINNNSDHHPTSSTSSSRRHSTAAANTVAFEPYAGSAPAVVGGVRSDIVEVSQSRAVEGVREALALAGIGRGGGGGMGIGGENEPDRLSGYHAQNRSTGGGIMSVLSSSPGRMTSHLATAFNANYNSHNNHTESAPAASGGGAGGLGAANSGGGGGAGGTKTDRTDRERRKSVKFGGVTEDGRGR
ncbi:WD domain-containing protein [Apiospora arundinis]|uniref:WD domain-containing protein n=1 Tax=Apiospora arundinis TaxID=335852 RepID=A0ABR2I0W6_9PEZI